MVACNFTRLIRLMPLSILNLLIQTSYRPRAYLIPTSSGYRTDLVSILLCCTLHSQRAGTTSASPDARQPKAGSFPPFGALVLSPCHVVFRLKTKTVGHCEVARLGPSHS